MKEKIIKILKEEIPHQCKISKESPQYDYHMNHIVKQIIKEFAPQEEINKLKGRS